MFDVHTHLEQPQYDKDRDDEIERLKRKLKGIITCATHPKHFQLGLDLRKEYKDFIFLSMGVHPAYVEEINNQELDKAFEFIRENKNQVVSVGESGLDFHWVKDKEQRKRQIERLKQTIDFANSIKKPITVHCRNEAGTRNASEELIKVMEDYNVKNLHWHLFQYNHVEEVVKNNWKVSLGPLILNSKTAIKIVKELPMENIMLETDSPWWGGGKRGTSLNIVPVAKKIAEIKEISFDNVWEICGQNAINFFNLE